MTTTPAVFGARATPLSVPGGRKATIRACWRVRQGRGYYVGHFGVVRVRAPLVLEKVEELEAGMATFVVENPTEERQPVYVTIVGRAIVDPLTVEESREVEEVCQWIAYEGDGE